MLVSTTEPSTLLLHLAFSTNHAFHSPCSFLLQARDGGGTEVSAPITIIVADINDNAPVFQGPFDTTIPENFRLVDTV